MQFQVMNSPFNEEQAELLNRLLSTLNESQKVWLSGYLAAPSSAAAATVEKEVSPESATAVAAPINTREVTILYGSHTGNCQELAENLSQKLKQQDFDVTLSSLDDFKPKSIKKVEDLLILTSTHGDGDPPDNAMSFYDFLFSKRAPKLDGVRYSILALGDSSYEYFCQTGKDFDQRLEELGAERIHPRIDCDVDYEEPADEWFTGVINQLNEQKSGQQGNQASTGDLQEQTAVHTEFSKSNPFEAEILENIDLNGRGSNKETRHIELDLEGSNLEYEPGDSLGIFPENDSSLVDTLIEEMQWDPQENVAVNKQGEYRPLREALTSYFEITNLTKPLLEKVTQFTNNEKLTQLIAEDQEELKAYIHGRDLIDLVRDFGPWQVSPQEFTGILRKIPFRLYSIASSSKANPDEVHLTIGAVRYNAHNRDRTGVCSVQCAERSEIGDTLPIFVQRNSNFKLPENPDTPIIMIGAGTGIAPYRAFLQEREEIEATGESWLFFGEQHFESDFLYQVEWQRMLQEGTLTKMDVAFSRDNTEKVYVQHRMLEKSDELYQWIKNGAHVYVCGDEKYMAKDVHAALLTIFEKEGNMTPEEAEEFLSELRKTKRYQRDVY
ncbi:assimilatory sulfite reductase (NADPH) flavoprotein subunit [Pontibacillus marinus]|uniref:assimilatory sulfite reductase (NADPH) n=1 Tax=Pontibacillus marinus BH030004 = DSM 16465 TaxID=1385511 RepID=A0A0A5GKX0_9BACI|nr:assimilatory sulfite reductase (NADPH) flavoprotein subunit [Pontibacillus marinus]KGX91810.1 sulfite reductase subunit alpha [Pontibacillus marinus BH030004 = DSM 16465]